MERKYFNFNYLKKEKGSVIMIVLLILVVIPILGMALLSATTSNFKLTGIEREFQSVYYVAEAGINHVMYDIKKKVDELSDEILSHEEFFDFLDEYISDKYIDSESNPFILNEFKKIFGEFPQAEIEMVIDAEDITVDENASYNEGVKSYTINSKGEIGKLSRTVSTSIEIARRIETGTEPSHHPAFDYLMYSGGEETLKIPSGSNIDGSIYGYNISFNASGTEINGSIISEKSATLSDGMKIKGNIYAMDGTVEISSNQTNVFGNIHATDNVTLNSGTTLNGSIFTNGGVTLKNSNVNVTDDIHAKGNISLGSASKVKNIYTGGNIEFLSTGAVINGDIHATGYVGSNDSGGNVTVVGDIFSGNNVITRSWQTYNFQGNVHASGNIENGAGNYISGNAISAKNVINNNGTIDGMIIENGDPIAPQSPMAPNFEFHKIVEKPELNKELLEYEPSSTEEIISTNTLRIPPGNYGIIKFDTNEGGKLVLESGGHYFFNAITGENQKKTLGLDFSKGGDIKIYVKNDLKWNGTIEISTNGTDWVNLKDLDEEEQKSFAKRIYCEIHGIFEMHEGGDKQWMGILLNKNVIKLIGNSYIVGSLATHGKFSVDNYGITFLYVSRDIGNEGSGNNGNSGDENDEGQDITSSKCRIKIISPIREK